MAGDDDRRRGRPRDPDLDDAVLGATVELLGERGYQRLRIADIAERAGTGLGALYRRWSSKRDVVLAALDRVVPDRDLPVIDDPAEDVLAGLRRVAAATTGPGGRLLAGLLPDLMDDPDLAAAVRGRILRGIRGEHRERVRRLVGDVPDLDVRADLAPSYVLLHGLFLGRSVSEEELRTLVRLTQEPAAGAPPRDGGSVDPVTGAGSRTS
ncbi:MAG TPA: TetR/AcrR family transcriptional regulator [Actinomycetospora sp.]|nr:TetR/AcrR family transcriptional regulator [Actinomycetospora sp.]